MNIYKNKQNKATSNNIYKSNQNKAISMNIYKISSLLFSFFFLQGLTLSNLDQNSFYACTILPHTFNLFFYSQWTKQNRWRLLVLIQLTVVKQNAVNNDWL